MKLFLKDIATKSHRKLDFTSLRKLRMSKKICLLSLFFTVMTTACAHSIHQLYVGSMDPKATYNDGKWVTADSLDFVVLGFQFDTNYVESAYRELESKCSGRIAQVTTEHLTSFLFLSYNQKVVLKHFFFLEEISFFSSFSSFKAIKYSSTQLRSRRSQGDRDDGWGVRIIK